MASAPSAHIETNKPMTLKRRRPSFTESDSLKPNVKTSLFEKLLPGRKAIFDKIPSSNKGLAFSGPGIKLGDAGTFSFTTTEKVDKVEVKQDDTTLCARYKKDSRIQGLFDVSATKQFSCTPGFTYLLKYEQTHKGLPAFVIGADYSDKKKGVHATTKFNALTKAFKLSYLHEGGSMGVPKGFRFAADSKCYLDKLASNPETISFNLGFSYENPLGHTGIAYNEAGVVTVTHLKEVCPDLSVGLEVAQNIRGFVGKNVGKTPKMPIVLAANYKINKKTLLRAKLNKDLVLNLGVKKDFSPQFNVAAGTSFDLRNPANALQPPTIGFKVSMKA